MSADEPVTLRYFPICGRAQPLRHALLDAGVAFDDEHIALEEWPRHKERREVAGAYRGLPTLRWGDDLIAETLPIASFLARRLGHDEGLDDAARAHHEAVCSCCYIEVTLSVGQALWADVAWPGADLERAWPLHLERILGKLALLDREAPSEAFFGGARPVMADFYADEAYATLSYVLGPDRAAAVRARLPRLAGLYKRLSARPRLANIRTARPARYTARPDEDAVVERLRALDLTALGL